MSADRKAVFLSYASQDAETARRICESLRAAGVEVWFDQSELRGGDAWDQKIRRQIKECALFVPIISANTQARQEGYFRIEWKLAAQRTHAIADGTPFLLPVVIDESRDDEALVPEEFRAVQWTKLGDNDASAEFAARVQALLGNGGAPMARSAGSAAPQGASDPTRREVRMGSRLPRKWLARAVALILVGVTAATFFPRNRPAAASAVITSLAVKPLDDFSGDAKQAYLSDGMTEALCSALSNLSALRVPGRSTVMRYKSSPKSIGEMARELGVDAIIEGSIQRAANEVKIDVRLIDGRSDKTLWNASYIRDLSQFFRMQSEVAQAVGEAIKLQLTPEDRARLGRARTSNPEAIESYLLGMQLWARQTPESGTAAVRHFLRAIEIDPNFAQAHAGASLAYPWLALPRAENRPRSREFARRAIELDPFLAEGYVARGNHYYFDDWDWRRAEAGFRRAVELSPTSPLALSHCAMPLVTTGRFAEAIALTEKMLRIDPLSPHGRWAIAAYFYAGRFADAVRAFEAKRDIYGPTAELGLAYALNGELDKAIAELEAAARAAPDVDAHALAYTYARAGRPADALQLLAAWGESPRTSTSEWYPRAWVHLALGDRDAALNCLEKGCASRDPLATILKVDPILAPLRDEPRYRALLKKMGFDG